MVLRAAISSSKASLVGAKTVALRWALLKLPLKLAASMAATRVVRPAFLAVAYTVAP